MIKPLVTEGQDAPSLEVGVRAAPAPGPNAPAIRPGKTKVEQTDMAKSQKRSSREVRKPKATKAKPPVAISGASAFPVSNLIQKPKIKL